jgi:hypothetical protein
MYTLYTYYWQEKSTETTYLLCAVGMKLPDLQSPAMPPERTRRLVAQVEAWLQLNHTKQKDLAAMLYMTPQQLNDILKHRTNPTSEQTLHLQEIIKSKPERRRRGPKG